MERSSPWFEDAQLLERPGFGTQEDALFSLPVSVPIWAFLFALTKPARRLVLNEQLSTRDILRDTLSVYFKVLVTTTLTATLLLVALLMYVAPFLIIFPFLLRAPYEASKGAWPWEAVSRSSRAVFRTSSTSSMARNDVFYAFAAFAALRLAVDSLISVGLPFMVLEVLDSVLFGTVLFALWYQCFASFLNGDAAMSGHLNPGNVADLRTPTKSQKDQFFLGKSFGDVRTVGSVVGVLAIMEFVGFYEEPERLIYPTDHLVQPGHASPEFTLNELDGPTKTSSDYLGTPTIYYLWAPWCNLCEVQNNVMKELQIDVGDEVDIVSIALSFEENDELRDYVQEHKVNYEVLVGDDDVSEQFNLNSYPTVILVDAKGLVHSNWAGSALSDEIHSALKELEK